MKKKRATIYLIESVGPEIVYKIGHTTKPIENRLKQLQSNNPNELRVVSTFETEYGQMIERTLHRHFCSASMRHEWFSLNEEEVRSFEELCERHERNFCMLEEKNSVFRSTLK